MDLCTPRLTNTATLDLWRDGLLCAYEFIPAISKKFKVGGEFNSQGPVQGRFDAEFSLQTPNVLENNTTVDSENTKVDDSENRSSSASTSPKSAASSLETEIQGFVVRESLKKDEGRAARARLDHQPSEKKSQSSQWVPIGWQRLQELFQGLQVRNSALCE